MSFVIVDEPLGKTTHNYTDIKHHRLCLNRCHGCQSYEVYVLCSCSLFYM